MVACGQRLDPTMGGHRLVGVNDRREVDQLGTCITARQLVFFVLGGGSLGV